MHILLCFLHPVLPGPFFSQLEDALGSKLEVCHRQLLYVIQPLDMES